MAKGFTIDAMDYVMLLSRREAAQRRLASVLQGLGCAGVPGSDSTPRSSTRRGRRPERMLPLDDTEVSYVLNIVYPMWAIFTGQPATAFPAGLNSAGLPLGLQAIGPYLEDRTTIRFAQLLEREWYSFEHPPGY